MPYVNVPNDLSKIKTKLAFNLTKRQLVCFGIAATVGIPSYLLARFLRPGVRPYQTENIYAPFTQRGAVRKEDTIAKSKKPKARPRKGR